MKTLTESGVEQAALDWLVDVGWTVVSDRDVGPDKAAAECRIMAKSFLESSCAECWSG